MRLGELRTLSKEFDNRLMIKLACYDKDKGVTIHDLDFDMSNDNELYFRVIEWLEKNVIFVEMKWGKIIILIKEDTLVILVQKQ